MNPNQNLITCLKSIVAEMKRIGYWSDQVVPPTPIKDRSALGLGSLPYAQWLQYIFIPSVEELIEEKAPIPGASLVGAMAVREFAEDPGAKGLVEMLCEFDNELNRQE